jgi:hypothetical protein
VEEVYLRKDEVERKSVINEELKSLLIAQI